MTHGVLIVNGQGTEPLLGTLCAVLGEHWFMRGAEIHIVGRDRIAAEEGKTTSARFE